MAELPNNKWDQPWMSMSGRECAMHPLKCAEEKAQELADAAKKARDNAEAAAKKLANEASEAAKKAHDKAKELADKAEDAAKKAQADLKKFQSESAKDKWRDISHAWNKFNMAATVPRAAGLALARINFLGFSRKWYPALLTQAELKAKHYDLNNAAVVKQLWDTKIKDFWESMGGDISALDKAVRKGFDKVIFKTKKTAAAKRAENGQSFDGNTPFKRFVNEYDFSVQEANLNNNFISHGHSNSEAYVEAAIAAGGAIVIAALNNIGRKGGAKDNPYVAGSDAYKSAENDAPPETPALTPQDDESLKAIELAALEDRRKNGLDPNTYEAEFNAIVAKYDKFLGMPKPLGILVAITGTTLAIWGLVKLVKHFNK